MMIMMMIEVAQVRCGGVELMMIMMMMMMMMMMNDGECKISVVCVPL